MDIEKALKLIDAGFTAEEIRKMIPQKTEVSPVLSPEPEAAANSPAAAVPAPEVKEEKKEEPDPMDAIRSVVAEQIAATMKGYEDNMAKLAKMAGMPSMEKIEPKGVDDIISNFLKEA